MGFLCWKLWLADFDLQVKNVKGQFVPAPPIEGTVLVNIADLMQRWTADKLKSSVRKLLVFWFYLTSGVKAGAMLTCNFKSEWVQDIICLIDLFNEGGREGGQSLPDSPPPPGLCPLLEWPQLKVITPTFVSVVSLNSAAIFFSRNVIRSALIRVQVNRFSAQNSLWSSLYYRRVIKDVTLHANCFLGPSCVNSRVWAKTFCCPPLLGVVYRSRSQWSYRMCGWLE